MTINTTTGLITWTPTDAQAPNGYFPVVSSTNAAGTSTLTLGIAVQINDPSISATFPGTTGGTAYSNLAFPVEFLDSSGAPKTTWVLDAAPAGATMSATGRVTWTPTVAEALAANTATFTVTATNYAGSSTYSVTVPLLTLAPPSHLAYSISGSTLNATWVAPAISAKPVASYEVGLQYVYVTSGSGRGGHGTVHTGA
jgi:hypothetical protein